MKTATYIGPSICGERRPEVGIGILSYDVLWLLNNQLVDVISLRENRICVRYTCRGREYSVMSDRLEDYIIHDDQHANDQPKTTNQ